MKKILISLSVVVGLLVISYVGIITYGWIGIQKAVDPRKGMSADSSMERVKVTMKYKSIAKETVLFVPKSYFIFARHRNGGVQQSIVLRMYDIDGKFIPWSIIRDRETYNKYKSYSLQLTIEAGGFNAIKDRRIPIMMNNIEKGKASLVKHKHELLKYKEENRGGFELIPDSKEKTFYIYCSRGAVMCRYYRDYKDNIYYGVGIDKEKLDQHERLSERVQELIRAFELN